MARPTIEQMASNCERAKQARQQALNRVDAARERFGQTELITNRLILGVGLAGSLNHATLDKNEDSLAIAEAEDPWRSRSDWRLGQPVRELVSEGFPLQPGDFTRLHRRFASTRALVRAIDVAQAKHAMVPFVGLTVRQPLDVKSDTVIVDTGTQQIRAKIVDVAIGSGPPRRLSASIIPADVSHELERSERLVYGQDQLLHPVKPGLVVVLGGGPTAAWNALHAANNKAIVFWIGTDPARRGLDRKPLVQAQADRIERHVRRGNGLRDAAWKRLLERTIAFSDAHLPRNRSAFRTKGVTWVEGAVESVTADPEGMPVVDLKLSCTNSETVRVTCDQLVVAMGTDPNAVGGAAYLAQKIPELTWIEHNGASLSFCDGVDSRGRIVAISTPEHDRPVQVRFIGAAMNQVEANHPSFAHGSTTGNMIRAGLSSQAELAPRHSRGIGSAIYQAGINIPLANGQVLTPALGERRAQFVRHSFLRGS